MRRVGAPPDSVDSSTSICWNTATRSIPDAYRHGVLTDRILLLVYERQRWPGPAVSTSFSTCSLVIRIIKGYIGLVDAPLLSEASSFSLAKTSANEDCAGVWDEVWALPFASFLRFEAGSAKLLFLNESGLFSIVERGAGMAGGIVEVVVADTRT